MSRCDACHLELGDGFVVEDDAKFCTECIEMVPTLVLAVEED